uniref:Intraflagellar transport protein 57 homolog n=1 Tax=Catharus ustulatus TaxID=91951 RepID=A0A8C3TRQ8_CATUS
LLLGTALLSTSGAAGRRGDRDRAEEGPAERGPGAAFLMFVLMEDLLDKLKLLSYEEEALRRHNMRPLSRLSLLAFSPLLNHWFNSC